MTRDEAVKAVEIAERLRRDTDTRADRAWLVEYLHRTANTALKTTREGRPSKHALRYYCLTMDALVNHHSEKELQRRWDVRVRTKDIIQRYKERCELDMAAFPNTEHWHWYIETHRLAMARNSTS